MNCAHVAPVACGAGMISEDLRLTRDSVLSVHSVVKMAFHYPPSRGHWRAKHQRRVARPSSAIRRLTSDYFATFAPLCGQLRLSEFAQTFRPRAADNE